MKRALLVTTSLIALTGLGSCRPVPPRGLPQDPGEALSSLQGLQRPVQLQLLGRFRAEISGIAMDFGVDLLADERGNARIDLDYPFGGHALTLILSEEGALLGTAHGLGLVLFTADASPLMARVLGAEAGASLMVDLLLGRLPRSLDGEVTWERRGQQTMLAMRIDDGRRALFELERRPARLNRMVVLDNEQAIVATASWGEWSEVEGYWIPGAVELDVPGSIGVVTLSVREVDTAPEVSPQAYELVPPQGEYQSFESLLAPK